MALNCNTGGNRLELPVAELPEGVYFVTLSLDGVPATTSRFIVTH